jgi:hypothetical protein
MGIANSDSPSQFWPSIFHDVVLLENKHLGINLKLILARILNTIHTISISTYDF